MPGLDFLSDGAPVILHAERVRKVFNNGTVALDGIDLAVREGEFLTLLGPSGCGKTTLIRIIAGFEALTSGQVSIDGKSILDAPPYHRPIGMVFQNLALFPHMDVAANIGYGLKVRGMGARDITKKVGQALEMVGLVGFGSRHVSQISGGQRQRVALARAIVTEPRVLLLDEPLGALDMKIRRQMQAELKQIQETLGTTFIFVTHDQEEALTMSDRIAVFRQGHLEQLGTPLEVYERPVSRYVAEFVGDTNFFEGRVVVGTNGTTPAFFHESLGLTCRLPEGHEPGSRVGLSLRPQYLRLADANAGRLQARVKRHAYAGQTVRVWLETEAAAATLLADWRPGEMSHFPETDELVGLDWDDRHAVAVPL